MVVVHRRPRTASVHGAALHAPIAPLLAPPVCIPGYGLIGTSAACQACAIGTWSAGGNATVKKPPCSPCATGLTTLSNRRTSPNKCSGEAAAADAIAGLWAGERARHYCEEHLPLVVACGPTPSEQRSSLLGRPAILRKPAPNPCSLPVWLWRLALPRLCQRQLVSRRQRDRGQAHLHGVSSWVHHIGDGLHQHHRVQR